MEKNKKSSKYSNDKAITLIALIITIIIMLILVGVSISLVIQSDLIGVAQDAGDKTTTKYQEEAELSGVSIGDKTYESIEDYIAGTEKIEEAHNWQYTDNTRAAVKCVCSECKKVNAEGQTLYIGQEVAYGEDSEPTWIIFGVEDKNKNDTNESVLITTLEPSDEVLELEGAEAYNSGIAEIEALCKELYGEEARAMTIEDVNNTLGYTPTGGMYNDLEGNVQRLDGFETTLDTLEIWNTIKAHNIERCEGKYYTPEYPEGTTDETKLGKVKIDGYWYLAEDVEDGLPYVPETTSDVVKAVVFGEEYELSYWLASRGVRANHFCARFGQGLVDGDSAYTCNDIFYSDSRGWQDIYFAVRPVVSLTSEIPELGEILVGNITSGGGR